MNKDNFNIGYHKDGDVFNVYHFYVAPENRGTGMADTVLETLVHVAYYEGCESIEVHMGGGERAERFLTRNGFDVIERREYDAVTQEAEPDMGAYGVSSVRRLK